LLDAAHILPDGHPLGEPTVPNGLALCKLSPHAAFDSSVMRFERITVDARQMGGVPCIRGLRMPVATVVGMVAEGMAVDEILREHPTLEAEDIREALQYAAEAVRERMIPLDA
jgi:uncharacterized protein (DUF433 family)